MLKRPACHRAPLQMMLSREKDALIKKYEDMFSGDMDAGEDGVLSSEIIRELKEEVEDLEKERNKMTVDLEMLKDRQCRNGYENQPYWRMKNNEVRVVVVKAVLQRVEGRAAAGLRSFLEAWKASSSLIPI